MWNRMTWPDIGIQLQRLSHPYNRREIVWNGWRCGHSTKQSGGRDANFFMSRFRQWCAESFIGRESNISVDEFQFQRQSTQDLFGAIDHFGTDAITGQEADFMRHTLFLKKMQKAKCGIQNILNSSFRILH